MEHLSFPTIQSTASPDVSVRPEPQAAQQVTREPEGAQPPRVDIFERTSDGYPTGVYNRDYINQLLAQKGKTEYQLALESYLYLMQTIITFQGKVSSVDWEMELPVSSIDTARLKEAIEPGGEYSVDAVATRIMDMAERLAYGDSSKIATLKRAMDMGFAAAGKELGGRLPTICQDTYKEVMNRFDTWEKSARSSSTVSG